MAFFKCATHSSSLYHGFFQDLASEGAVVGERQWNTRDDHSQVLPMYVRTTVLQ